MSFRRSWICLLLLVLCPGAVRAQDAKPPFRVLDVRAHPFFHESGTFSDRDLFDPTLALRNTPIGEGSLPERSSIALVLVDVEGRFLAGRKEALQFSAKTPTHTVAEQLVPVSTLFSESKVRVTVPFLLYDVGCERVTIQIRFSGIEPAPPVYEKAIPYLCGE